jgi:hypothetical protein
LHVAAEVPESLAAELKRQLIDCSDVVEFVVLLFVYAFDVFVFIRSHHFCHLLGDFRTENGVRFSKSLQSVGFSEYDEMSLTSELRDEYFVGLNGNESSDADVSALERDSAEYIRFLYAGVKERGHVVKNEKDVGIYAERLSQTVVDRLEVQFFAILLFPVGLGNCVLVRINQFVVRSFCVLVYL